MSDFTRDTGVDADSAAGDPTASHPKSARTSMGAECETDDPGVTHPDDVDREFGWRGWILVAAIVFAFFVAPGIIILYPHVGPMFGLTFWDTYLALPMIPALIIGILAVWATTRP